MIVGPRHSVLLRNNYVYYNIYILYIGGVEHAN